MSLLNHFLRKQRGECDYVNAETEMKTKIKVKKKKNHILTLHIHKNTPETWKGQKQN